MVEACVRASFNFIAAESNLNRIIKKLLQPFCLNPGIVWLGHRLVIGSGLHWEEARAVSSRARGESLGIFDVFFQFYLSNAGFLKSLSHSRANHLHLIHQARLKMVRSLIPKARRILDIGGANCPLYEMGYIFPFEYMCMVDLPVADRHSDFKKIWNYGDAKIEVKYLSMINLEGLQTGSFDLVWMGQVIEHVAWDDAKAALKEAFRVLEPGGKLVLDTPNRDLTKLHVLAEGVTGFIHPEHQHEFTRKELEGLIQDAGFIVTKQLGICEMNQSYRNQKFNYEDFSTGNAWCEHPERSYILYFEAKKP